MITHKKNNVMTNNLKTGISLVVTVTDYRVSFDMCVDIPHNKTDINI